MKKIALFLAVIISILTTSACKKDEQYFFGGDMTKVSFILSDSERTMPIMIPIATNKKINDIKFVSYDSDCTQKLDITDKDFYKDEYAYYKGYYLYYKPLLLRGSNLSKDNYINANITAVNLLIDGKEVKFDTPYLKYTNGLMYDGKIIECYSDGSLFYGELPTIKYFTIPSKEENKQTYFTVQANDNLTIKEVRILDYVEMEDFSSNSKNPEKIDDKLIKDQKLTYSSYLKYKDSAFKGDLVKTSRAVIYEHNGQIKALYEDSIPYIYNNVPPENYTDEDSKNNSQAFIDYIDRYIAQKKG